MAKAAAFLGAAALAILLISAVFLPVLAWASLAALAWAMAAGWAMGWLLLRHAGLSFLAMVAPLPGLGLSLALGVSAGLDAYGFGFAVALVLAAAGARRLLDGDTRDDALTGLVRMTAPLVVALALLAAGLAQAWMLALPFVFCALSAALLLPAGIAFLPLGENFFTRANRARELRQLVLAGFAAVAQPRWSASVTGIAVVLAVLIGFGWHPASAAPWLGVVIVFAATLVYARGPRAALGAGLAFSLFGFYAPGSVAGFAVFAFFTAVLAARIRQDADAWAQTLEEEGGTLMLGAFAVMAMLAPVSPHEAWSVAAGALAALLFFPALSVAFEQVWPRRRGLAELYRT